MKENAKKSLELLEGKTVASSSFFFVDATLLSVAGRA